MSLSLLQGYSSAEEDPHLHLRDSDDEGDDNNGPASSAAAAYRSAAPPRPSHASGLPSALDAFSQISGPPEFLNNSVEEYANGDNEQARRGGRRTNREKKDVPSGAVVEAKPQLVGIHDRVRSDIEGKPPPTTVSSTPEGGKRVATATNPKPEDAAELLRMCLQCGVPKTYTSARGMVCPVCGDRPPTDASNEQKKKGSTVKDKEKVKRMRGQSSHATWKSETEMQLRQQFD